ncbi:MFS transporter [Streptomyces anulatus]|uniref:MFS transporter n=1 Tax=Streptomyces anulatus TaxID=1892 RepID=UPI003625B0FE
MTSLTPATAAAKQDPRLWGLLFVLAGNMLIDALEVSVLVVAAPSIGADLRLAPAVLQWTISGFALGFGGLLLFGARVVALLGRRRVYLAALLAFAAASLVAALATDPALLTATRFVKGFCAALTAPTGLAIISTAFREGPARDRAVSVYTLFGAAGFTAGLLLSGLLTSVSWRWTLAFPAPVVLLLFLFARRLLPPDEPTTDRSGSGNGSGGGEPDRAADTPAAATAALRYDVAGAATLAGGLLTLVYGISLAAEHGWRDVRTLTALVLGTALLAAFAVAERRTPWPLMATGPAAHGPLIRSALGAAALNGSYIGLLFVLTLHLQTVLGRSPLETALALAPASVPLAATALFSGRLVARFGTARLIAAGAVPPFAGQLLLLRDGAPTQYLSGVLPVLLLVAAGFVLAFAALNTQAVAGLPAAERGMAGGIYQTAVQTGAALMAALVAVLLQTNRAAAGASAADVVSGYRPALLLIAAVGAVGVVVGVSGLVARDRKPGSREG